MKFRTNALTLAAVVVFGVATAQAGPIPYPGNFQDLAGGGVVTYTDVEEDSATDDPPLFGEPTVVVNRLDFDPNGFGASAVAGGADLTDGQLNFSFHTLPGSGLTSFTLNESGSYTLVGGGTAGTQVIYGALVEVTILEVDHVALATPVKFVASGSETLDLIADGAAVEDWSFSLLVEFGSALNAVPEHGVTKAEVVIDNTLVAISESDPSTVAFLDKKDFFLDVDGDLEPDEIIPEAATATLALAGLGVLMARRRR